MVPPKPAAPDAANHSGGSGGSINTTSIKTSSIKTSSIKTTSINTHTNASRIVNVGAEARPANWSTSDLSFNITCPGGQCPLQTRPCDACQYFRIACRDSGLSNCRLQPSSFEQQMTIVVETITSYTYAACASAQCKSLLVRCVNGRVSVSASPQAYNLVYISSKFTYTVEACSGPDCGKARMCDDKGDGCTPLAPPKGDAPAPLPRQGVQVEGQQPGRQQPSQAGPSSPSKGRPTASGSDDEDDSCEAESPSASGVSISNNVKLTSTGPENQGARGSVPKAPQPGPGSQGISGSPDNKGQPPRGSDGQTPSSSPSNQGRPSGPESHGAPVSSDKNPSSKGSEPAPQGHVAPPSSRQGLETIVTESVHTTTSTSTSGSSRGGNVPSGSSPSRPQEASSGTSSVPAGGRATSSPVTIVSAGSNAHVLAFTSLVVAVAGLALVL